MSYICPIKIKKFYMKMFPGNSNDIDQCLKRAQEGLQRIRDRFEAGLLEDVMDEAEAEKLYYDFADVENRLAKAMERLDGYSVWSQNK